MNQSNTSKYHIFAILLGVTLSSCSPISNSIDELILICGQLPREGAQILKWDNDSDYIEAFQKIDEVWKSLDVSRKGCVETFSQNDVVVRSKDKLYSAIISPSRIFQVTNFSLQPNSEKINPISCPTSKFVSRDLSFSDFISTPENKDTIIWGVSTETFSLFQQSFDSKLFRDAISDGEKELTITNENLLTGSKSELKCLLSLDSTAPAVNWNPIGARRIDALQSISLEKNTVQNFSVEDADINSKVEYCFVEPKNVENFDGCSESKVHLAFKSSSISLADLSGEWAIAYRGIDSLGNRSEAWKLSEIFLVEDRVVLEKMNLRAEKFSAINQWDLSDVSEVIHGVSDSLAEYARLGSSYEKQLASEYILPFLLKINRTPFVKSKKIDLDPIVSPLLGNNSLKIIDVVGGEGTELALATEAGEKTKVIHLDPMNIKFKPKMIDIDAMPYFAEGTYFGEGIFTFHTWNEIQIVGFDKNIQLRIKDLLGVNLLLDQKLILYTIDKKRKGIIKLPQISPIIFETELELISVYETDSDFYIISKEGDIQKCNKQLDACVEHFSIKTLGRSFKVLEKFGKILVEDDGLTILDITSLNTEEIYYGKNLQINHIFFNGKNSYRINLNAFQTERWVDIYFEANKVGYVEMLLVHPNQEYIKLKYSSERYAISEERYGPEGLPQNYLFDLHSKKNVFPIEGKYIISGNQQWLFRMNRSSFIIEPIFIGEIENNKEIDLQNYYSDFNYLVKTEDEVFFQAANESIVYDYLTDNLFAKGSPEYISISSKIEKVSGNFSISIENQTISVNKYGELLGGETENFSNFTLNYPLLGFYFMDRSFVFDYETKKIYKGVADITNYIKTKFGIQTYFGEVVQGVSLGPIGESRFAGNVIKIGNTNLIGKITPQSLEIFSAANLRRLVVIKPQNSYFYHWFLYDPDHPNYFMLHEIGKNLFYADFTRRLEAAVEVWELDFSLERQIQKFCGNIVKWKYDFPNLNDICQKNN